MTTKKNMVKLALMSALTAVTMFSFTACSDDLNELNNVEALNSLDSNKLLNLEQYSYEENFEVNATGPWQIDFNFDDDDHHFVYALPDHGVGNREALCARQLDRYAKYGRDDDHLDRKPRQYTGGKALPEV